MLQVLGLAKSYGVHTVLENISFVINDRERVGMVGPNGCGKSTLLRCIVGLETPDAGRVVRRPGLRVGYLPQFMAGLGERSVAEVLEDAQRELVEAEQALAVGAARLGEGEPDALDAYDAALELFEALGGYERQQQADLVLEGLGLGAIDRSLPAADLSGGQKTRLGLACLLLSHPDLLLLDEPTNHLDVEALEWLEMFITSFPGAVLVVSHDREFLDRTVERVLFLDPNLGEVLSYPGNYSDFSEARAREAQAQAESWKRQREYVGKVESDIARLKGEALAIERSTTPRQPGVRKFAKRKAQVAKSREKKLARFLEADERVEKPALNWGLKLDFGEPPSAGRDVLRLEQFSFAYPGAEPLFTDLSLGLRYGDRVALVGPNGAGKSTLLKLMQRALSPTSGRVALGANVRVGVLAQEQETLDPGATVLETALRERSMSETEARSFLHFFLFGGDSVFWRVADCSLGERTRLQFAGLVLRGCNLLLLDEPLNHLDIDGREHFQAALDAFEGTVVAVAHDRAFLRAFAERVVEIRAGRARVVEGGYDDYLAELERHGEVSESRRDRQIRVK